MSDGYTMASSFSCKRCELDWGWSSCQNEGGMERGWKMLGLMEIDSKLGEEATAAPGATEHFATS